MVSVADPAIAALESVMRVAPPSMELGDTSVCAFAKDSTRTAYWPAVADEDTAADPAEVSDRVAEKMLKLVVVPKLRAAVCRAAISERTLPYSERFELIPEMRLCSRAEGRRSSAMSWLTMPSTSRLLPIPAEVMAMSDGFRSSLVADQQATERIKPFGDAQGLFRRDLPHQFARIGVDDADNRAVERVIDGDAQVGE